MKKKYFTKKNIVQKAEKMLSKIKKQVRQRNFVCQIRNSAILVLDMQNYFLNRESHAFVPSSKAIINNIKKLVDIFLINKGLVIFTKHSNNEQNANMMTKWWSDSITENSELSGITKQLIYPGLVNIEKHQYDAFYETNLKNLLNEKGIENIIITGVLTHLCCETTARAAFVNGFSVILPIDGTADYNEKFHTGSILNLSHGFAYTVTTDTLLKNINSGLSQITQLNRNKTEKPHSSLPEGKGV